MKPDMTANNNKAKRQIGLTSDHNSQPDKVLFFANPHFLFFKSRPTLHTLASHTNPPTNQSLPKSATVTIHSIILYILTYMKYEKKILKTKINFKSLK